MNRREFISRGIAALGMSAIASPVRSIVGGAETGIGDAAIPTVADYIQDGLIVLWDGIENAGIGVHDDASRIWIPAIGDAELKIPVSAMWSDDALLLDNTAAAASTNISSTETFRRLVDSVDACSITFQNVWTLNSYSPISSGLGEMVRNVMGPGYIYGHLCVRNATSVYLNSNGSGNGYYWSGSKNIGSVLGTHALTATYSPSGARAFCSIWHGNSLLGSDMVLPSSQVADENVSFANLKSATWRIGPYSNLKNCVDEIHCYRIYDRPLLPEEVAYNYTIDKMRFGL